MFKLGHNQLFPSDSWLFSDNQHSEHLEMERAQLNATSPLSLSCTISQMDLWK